MKKITIQCALCGMLAALVVAGMPVQETDACTRAVYLGPEDTIITVRSMDWKGDTKTNLWAFPRGLNRDGAAGPNSIRWTSKYGSLVAAGWDVGTADGMNEKGLVANMLYLVESEYVKPADNDKRKPLSISVWPQYVLDNFPTVAEAVSALSKEPFQVIAPISVPNST